jgi:formate hydrogenlyase subunit 6/NADH:ubiquinone oxidoreductase subunit I
MMTEQEIYEGFIEWLGSSWWQMPESEHRLPMVRAHYTPEEAAFLTDFPFRSTTLEEIAEHKGLTPEAVAPTVRALSRRGMIFSTTRGDSTRYRLSDPMLATMRANLWPQQPADEDWLRRTAPHINRYYLDNWADQWEEAHVKGLRAIPIHKTIKDTRQILPYEDVVRMVDRFEYFTVSNCPCRVRHRLDPEMPVCDHPLEVCLHFDELGRYIVANDMGREITREETLEILKQAADSGLVHGISTAQENADTICNCCGCCCLMFEPFHKRGHKGAIRPSNYKAEVDPSQCTACALCTKRCPVDAIQLRTSAEAQNKFGKAAAVDRDACVGCGVCAHKCPTDCLSLVVVDEPTEPPLTVRDWITDLREYQGSRE